MKGEAVMGREMFWQCLGEVVTEARLQEAWRGAEMKMNPEEPFTPMPE